MYLYCYYFSDEIKRRKTVTFFLVFSIDIKKETKKLRI